MMNRIPLAFSAIFTCFIAFSQGGVNCPEMAPICTDVGLNFTANADGDEASTLDPGNNYDCLIGQPNPTWYYFQIATDGNIEMELAASFDIDFAIWGPFSSLSVAQAACGSLGNQTPPDPSNGNLVDCSFSVAAVENPVITGAITGEVYVMLITNYAGVVQNITLTQTGGTGSTDCDIVINPPCSISAINTTVSGCDFITNNYSVTGTIETTNPPTSGDLVVEDCDGNTSVIASAPFNATSFPFTISNLSANGSACTLQAYFTSETTCSQTINYVSPACINNCPAYENQASSPAEACGNQQYFLEVQNTGCDGVVNFEVIGDYGTFPTEISWSITSNLTGNIVASGAGTSAGGTFAVTVGPLDPNIEGSIFNLEVEDAWGDGFSGGGYIQVESTDGSTVFAGPIEGDFGTEANQYFNSGIIVSSSTISVTTPSGTVTSNIANCADHSVPITLENNNYCTPTVVDLPWSITCDLTGDLIASGTHTVTVYPQVPTSASDLVSIDWNSTTCSWEVTPQNDCGVLDLGVLYSISPDPMSLGPSCADGTEEFTVTYLGFTNGPDCCSTGGPLTPATYTNSQGTIDFITQTAYGGTNNAAYGTISPSGVGGNSTSLTINVSGSGYCYPNVPVDPTVFPPDPEPDVYYVDIYVDGVQIAIYGPLNDPPGSFNYSFSHADLLAAGVTYNQNSTIEVYVLPNQFYYSGPPIINTTYVPGADCNTLAAGEWSASNFSIDVNATYEQLVPSPANCTFIVSEPYTCCVTNSITALPPANENVECLLDVPAADINSVTNIVSDCPTVVAFISDVSDGNTCPEIITRTYSVSDDCGNSVEVTQTITINDVTPPTASNPAGLIVECIDDVPTPDISVVNDAADNCTAVPTVSFVEDLSDGNTCPEIITRTYSVTDDCGNAINVTQTITINDITPPTASNPANINIPLAPVPAPDITVVTDAADNCTLSPIVAFVEDQSDGGDCPEVITRTYSVTDDCGNETLVTQLIIIGGGLVPSPTVIANGPICEGEDAVFTIDGLGDAVVTYDIGNGPETLTLIGGTGDVTVPSVNSDVTITLSNISDGSCSSMIEISETIVVNPLSLPTFAGFGPYCLNETPDVLPILSVEGYSGTWNPPSIDASTSGIGIYTFTPDPGQCTQSTTLDISIQSLITPSFIQIEPLCLNAMDPGLPTLSQDGISGIWSPSAINTSAVGVSTYTFTPDAGQCAEVLNMDIEIFPLPEVSLNDQLINCITNTSGAQIGMAGVVGNTYSWSPLAGITNPTISDPIATPSTTTLYTLTVTDVNGCTADGTVNVTVDDVPPNVGITNNTGTTTLSCTQLEISITATGADIYSWDNGLGNISSPSITSPGIYTVTGTGPNGCQSNAQIEIIQDNGVDLLLVLGQSEICSGETVEISMNSATATDFNWTVIQNGVTGASDGSVINTESGATVSQELTLDGSVNGTVDYVVEPLLSGCVGSAQTVTVTVLSPETPQFSQLGPFCLNDVAGVLPSSSMEGILGSWTPPTITTNTAGLSTYNFSPNPGQCAVSQNMDIVVNDLPIVSFSGDSLLGCAPHSVVLSSPNDVCTWTISNGIILEGNQVTLNLTNPGCYDVTLEVDENGCTNSLTMPNYLCVQEDPIANFTVSPDVFTDNDVLVSFTNLSSGASSFLWDFGDGNTSTYINPTNLYENTDEGALITLTAISEFGCTDQAQLIIEYDEQEVFYIPNTFTPDGDNFNQMFTPVFYSGFDPYNFEMLIFNRWGEIVFETHNAETGWDGTYGVNGTKAMDGTYSWKITYKNPKTDQRKVISGHVTLLR